MVRLLLIAVLTYIAARVLWRVLKGIFEGMGYQSPGSSPPSVGLVRDPVCGTFVVPSTALRSGSGSDTRYFCSEQCRGAYGHENRATEKTHVTEETQKKHRERLRHG